MKRRLILLDAATSPNGRAEGGLECRGRLFRMYSPPAAAQLRQSAENLVLPTPSPTIGQPEANHPGPMRRRVPRVTNASATPNW